MVVGTFWVVPSCWFFVETLFVVGGGVATGFATTTTTVVSGFGMAFGTIASWGDDAGVNEPNPKYRAPARAVPPIIRAAGILFCFRAAERTLMAAAAAAASWFLASRAFKFARIATNPAPAATPIPQDEVAVEVAGFLVGGGTATADDFLVPAGEDRSDLAAVFDNGGASLGALSRRDRGDDAGAAGFFGDAVVVVGFDLVLEDAAVVGAARAVRCFEATGAGFDCFSASAEVLGSDCFAFDFVVRVRSAFVDDFDFFSASSDGDFSSDCCFSVGFFRWFGGLFVAGFGSDGCDEDAAAFDLVGLTFRSGFTFGFGSGVRSRLYSPSGAACNTRETVEDDEALGRCRRIDGTTLVDGIEKASTPLPSPSTRMVITLAITAIAATMKTGLLLRIIIILGCRCQTNI